MNEYGDVRLVSETAARNREGTFALTLDRVRPPYVVLDVERKALRKPRQARDWQRARVQALKRRRRFLDFSVAGPLLLSPVVLVRGAQSAAVTCTDMSTSDK